MDALLIAGHNLIHYERAPRALQSDGAADFYALEDLANWIYH